MIRLLAVAALAVLLATPASAACLMSYCKDNAPTRSYITNTHRQKVGDLYRPGSGQRIQIRDTSRRIVGYIEIDGTITNPSRQKVGSLVALDRLHKCVL
jgi:hypothetical protein